MPFGTKPTDTLKDVLLYLISKYPEEFRHELSNARLTKMVYLADWHHSLTNGRQITGIKWFYDNYGPFVWDVLQKAESHPHLFQIQIGSNMHGGGKRTISLRGPTAPPVTLPTTHRQSLDHIIEVTKKLYWDDFIRLVYSTHPIVTSEKYHELDLVAKAKEYQALSRNKK